MDAPLCFENLSPCVREAGMQHGDMWQIPRRIYDHEMMLCLSGSASLVIGDMPCVLQPGQLAIIPPDTAHTLRFEDNTTRIAWFHFDFVARDDSQWIYDCYNTPEEYIHCFSARLPHPEHIRPNPVFPGNFRLPCAVAFDDASEITRLFLSLVQTSTRQRHRFAIHAHVTVLRILDLILEQCGYWKPDETVRVSDLIIQYIESNYMNRLTMQDICACTQYHPDYAGKLFRKETGSTVIDYLNRYRINKARTLLLDESITIAFIAEKCGFQSVNYFSSVTRRLTGKSPRELRAYQLSIKNMPEAK